MKFLLKFSSKFRTNLCRDELNLKFGSQQIRVCLKKEKSICCFFLKNRWNLIDSDKISAVNWSEKWINLESRLFLDPLIFLS